MSQTNDKKLKDALHNFTRALSRLEEAVSTPVTEPRDLAGIIKSFEFVYELSWLTLKRALAHEGRQTTTPRSVFSVAYQEGWIENEKVWLKMMEDRNETVHTYDEKLAREMSSRIKKDYCPLFSAMLKSLKARIGLKSEKA